MKDKILPYLGLCLLLAFFNHTAHSRAIEHSSYTDNIKRNNPGNFWHIQWSVIINEIFTNSLFSPGTFDNCNSSLKVYTTVSAGTRTFKASRNIGAYGVVEGSANVSFIAGNMITLEPGFHAREGSTTSMEILPCDDNTDNFGASRKTTSSVMTDIINEQLNIFPNPVANRLTIQTPFTLGSSQRATVEVCTIKGNSILKEVVTPGQEVVVDLSQQSEGIFLVKLYTASGELIVHKILHK
ncbi:hypothetical protein BKI52_22200 [marine bacterium AO1-C]|nr:hypothetical protein BKI52_22200 [marine bacterium AO1-C]